MGIYAYDKEVIPYLNNNISFSKGIYVAEIIKNSPASKTELKEGDIIISVDGKELNTMNDLREYIYNKKPNDVASLKISRGKITKEVEITLRQKVRQRGSSHLSYSLKLYFLAKSLVSELFIKTEERFWVKNSIIL